MTSPFWPGTNVPISQNNAFTLWRTEPRSIFRGDPQFRSNAAPQPKNPPAWGDSLKGKQ